MYKDCITKPIPNNAFSGTKCQKQQQNYMYKSFFLIQLNFSLVLVLLYDFVFKTHFNIKKKLCWEWFSKILQCCKTKQHLSNINILLIQIERLDFWEGCPFLFFLVLSRSQSDPQSLLPWESSVAKLVTPIICQLLNYISFKHFHTAL